MKKILSLFAAVLFAGSMMAAESVDFAKQGYTNGQAVASYEGTAFSIAFAKGTNNNAPKYYNDGTAIRCYGGNTLAFTASANITSIVFTFSTGEGTNAISASVGTFETNTWTGDAAAVTLTIGGTSGHRRIKAIDVYFAGETPAVITYDTLTVAQAIAKAQALDSMASSDKQYFVEGYVVYADPFSPSYNNQTFFLSDDPAVKDSTFEAYSALPKMGNDTVPVVDGDKVRAFGFLKKYYDTKKKVYQLEMGSPAVEVLDTVPGQDRSLPDIPTITVDSALKIGKALANDAVSTEYYVVEGYVSSIYTFFSQDFKNETFWISDDPNSTAASLADNAFEVYRGKANTGKAIGLGAKISIKCKIKNYKGSTIENDGNNVPFTVLEESTFVPDTLTVEEAVELASGLAAEAKAPKYSVIKGFVNSVTTAYASSSNTATFTMAQFPNESEGALSAYKASILKADSNKVKTVGTAPDSLYVNVIGYIMKHGSDAQIAQGAAVYFVEAPEMDTIRVDAATALADGLALAIGAKSDRIYAVTDIVSSAEEEDEGLQSFSMAEDFFEAYLAHVEEPVKENDKVEVVGRLKNVDGAVVQIEGGKARIIYPEGIENVVLTEKAQKVVVDGAVYIIRDNKMFNIHGAQVR